MAPRSSSIDSPNLHVTQYWSNGGGSDTYINFDNGGFKTLYEPDRSPDRGTTYLGNTKSSMNVI